MKILYAVLMCCLLISACNTNEPDNSFISPLSASKIDSLIIEGKKVTITTSYTLPTPCWYYLKTESTNDNNIYTSTVFGKYDGEVCIQILSSLQHTEQVFFTTKGDKQFRFWQNDSTYLDTTITLP